MTEEEKKAIEDLKLQIEYDKQDLPYSEECLKYEQIILNLLDKKDKVIDCLISEIIRMIYYYENYHYCEFEYDIAEKISKTQENIKRYFNKKVEEENE